MKTTINVLLLALLCGAVMAADEPDAKESKKGEKVAVYVGVDGVCFSTDGSKCGRFEKYLDRETAVTLSADELKSLITDLKEAGFEKEENRKVQIVDGTPPLSFTIHVDSPESKKEVVFLCEKGLTVPEKYLNILDALPDSKKPEALNKFISLARKKRESGVEYKSEKQLLRDRESKTVVFVAITPWEAIELFGQTFDGPLRWEYRLNHLFDSREAALAGASSISLSVSDGTLNVFVQQKLKLRIELRSGKGIFVIAEPPDDAAHSIDSVKDTVDALLENRSITYHEMLWKISEYLQPRFIDRSWPKVEAALEKQGFNLLSKSESKEVYEFYYLIRKNAFKSNGSYKHNLYIYFETAKQGGSGKTSPGRIMEVRPGLTSDVDTVFDKVIEQKRYPADSAVDTILKTDELKATAKQFPIVKSIAVEYGPIYDSEDYIPDGFHVLVKLEVTESNIGGKSLYFTIESKLSSPKDSYGKSLLADFVSKDVLGKYKCWPGSEWWKGDEETVKKNKEKYQLKERGDGEK